jgi:hypothetical protein
MTILIPRSSLRRGIESIVEQAFHSAAGLLGRWDLEADPKSASRHHLVIIIQHTTGALTGALTCKAKIKPKVKAKRKLSAERRGCAKCDSIPRLQPLDEARSLHPVCVHDRDRDRHIISMSHSCV